MDDRSVLEVIKFKDVTSELGLNTIVSFGIENIDFKNTSHIKTADYNGDGKTDMYIGSYDPSKKSYEHYLFSNAPSGLQNVTEEVGLDHKGTETGVEFADYDNDGFLDLYVILENESLLYRNADKGIFEDKTQTSKLFGDRAQKALFFDMDQDGDLDLFEGTEKGNRVFRNNGDGSFVEMANEMGLSGDQEKNVSDAAFGDFDDDGDIDLITIDKNGATILYTNKRQGQFEVMDDSGLESNNESRSIAVGDYNNDGFLDVFIASLKEGKSGLYTNSSEGKFEMISNTSAVFPGIENLSINDVEFLDFDNDGFQDLLLAGESMQKNGSGLLLFHNDR